MLEGRTAILAVIAHAYRELALELLERDDPGRLRVVGCRPDLAAAFHPVTDLDGASAVLRGGLDVGLTGKHELAPGDLGARLQVLGLEGLAVLGQLRPAPHLRRHDVGLGASTLPPTVRAESAAVLVV